MMTSDAETSAKKRGKRAIEETATSSRPKRVATTPATSRNNKRDTKRGSGSVRSVKAPPSKSHALQKAKKPDTPSSTLKKHTDTPAVDGSASAAKAETETGGSSRSYWLMKAEPESRFEKGVDVKFSIDDLREAKEPEAWDGVRNPAARNNMRAMKKGDLAFFYHSNCKVPGIAGVMEIVKEHSVDESAFDPSHPYYDPKSIRDKPKWEVVHVEFRRKFADLIKLADLKACAKKPGGELEGMQMMRQSRLSVSAVSAGEWEFIMGLVKDGNGNGDE